VELPFALSGGAVLFDELGNEQPFAPIEHSEVSTVITNLELGGGRIAIVKINK
jgi:hypothetical protein